MQIFQTIQEELRALAVSGKAESMQRFFKTGKGEYGEGDFFIGVSVPHQRLVAKSYCDDASAKDITALLDSKYHEERLTGVLILVMKYKKDKRKNIHEKWVNLFLNKTNRINNWDLVDSSAWRCCSCKRSTRQLCNPNANPAVTKATARAGASRRSIKNHIILPMPF